MIFTYRVYSSYFNPKILVDCSKYDPTSSFTCLIGQKTTKRKNNEKCYQGKNIVMVKIIEIKETKNIINKKGCRMIVQSASIPIHDCVWFDMCLYMYISILIITISIAKVCNGSHPNFATIYLQMRAHLRD
ncbi:hypothetical protein CR513_36021, partial [Mucuna pruriens]